MEEIFCVSAYLVTPPIYHHGMLGLDGKGIRSSMNFVHRRPDSFVIKIYVRLCGPDGIRTRDLGLDRAACLAATPRDH